MTTRTDRSSSQFNQDDDGYIKLSALDETMLSIVMNYLQLKLDKLKTDTESIVARREVVDCITMSQKICTQRTFSELFRNMREFLPKFFDFESVGILLKDQ
jgi:hypothetical protein